MHKLDRNSPLPLYHQLRESLGTLFGERQYQPGDRLPGDFELCEMYGVSRTVVRQALAELEAEGIVERIRGKGTFYATPKVDERLAQSLTGLYEDMAARGKVLVSQVRRLEVVPADASMSDALEIERYQPVILLERLRFVDGHPWALNITYIPFALAPALLDEDLSRASLYALLEQKYGVQLSYGRRTIEAAVASRPVAQALDVAVGSAVLVLRSISYDVERRPVEVFTAYHRGDRSRFQVDLRRQRMSREIQPLVVLTGDANKDVGESTYDA